MEDYEISNHALPGEECRHNLIYWRGEYYIGIGPGAHGRLPTHGLNEGLAVEAIQERSMEHRREEWQYQRAGARIAKAIANMPLEARQRRHAAGTRRRQRAAQLGDWGSRPSSAASSRSTSSYVSARSSATASSAASGVSGPAAAASLASIPSGSVCLHGPNSPQLTHY